MSDSSVINSSFFNSERIAIFPETNSMNGIFAYLKYLDGEYGSRYTIEANLSVGNPFDLVSYHDTEQSYVYTKKGEYDITVTFNTSFFYPTHYSIVNAGTGKEDNGAHSYNKDWDFVGIDDNLKEHLLDRQRNNTFCDKNLCSERITKTMIIEKPKAFKKFILRTIKGGNSNYEINGSDYFILKAIEFFGILCPENSNCNVKYKTCNIQLFHCNYRNIALFGIFLFSY